MKLRSLVSLSMSVAAWGWCASADASQAGSTLRLPLVNIVASDDVRMLAAGDFDEDGHSDLAFGQSGWNVEIMLGDGAGAFTSNGVLESGIQSASSMHAVDWNADGNADVVILGGTVVPYHGEVFYGDGIGGFSAAASFPMPTNGVAFSLASDWTGDGVVDLMVVDLESNGWHVSTLVNDGTGGVASTHTLLPGKAPTSIRSGDFDGDGDRDVVAAFVVGDFPVPDEIQLLINDGAGNFTLGASAPIASADDKLAVADFDGDGALDVAAAGTVFPHRVDLYRGDGDGGLSSQTFIGLWSPVAGLYAEDLNNDGRPDLLVGGSGGWSGAIYRNQGGFSFSGALTLPLPCSVGAILGDLNEDGRLDYVYAGHEPFATIAFGRQGLGFGLPALTASSAATLQLTSAGDFDEDGALDLLGFEDDRIVVLRGDGAFGMTPEFELAHPANSFVDAQTADLDGDGRLDFFASNWLSGTVELFYGDGDGDFTQASLPVAPRPRWIAAGDLTGDGLVDLAVAHGPTFGCELVTYAADGNGGFAGWLALPTSGCVYALRLGDLNADGALDIVANDSGFAHAYLNDGFGAFAGPTIIDTGLGSAYSIDLADLDGDDVLDFVGVRSTQDLVSYARGDGSGAFFPPTTLAAPDAPSFVRAADLDGDGLCDLLTGGGSADIAIFRNLGAGSFAAATHWSHLMTSPAVIGDYNRDGKRDLASTGVGVYFLPNLSVTGSNGFVYCEGKLNSQGCTARIGASGLASASAASGFGVDATRMLNKKTGQFFYSVAGTGSTPFAGGTLCVKPPLKRVQPLANTGGSASGTDCTGSLVIDVNALIASGSHPALTAGATAWMQAWSRDPGFAPPDNLSLTDALSFVVGP